MEARNGMIIASKYSYNDYVAWKFYQIIRHTPSRVTLQELETKTVFDDGKEGPHYYNDPYHLYPRVVNEDFVYVGDPITRAYKFDDKGNICIKTEDFYYARGYWNGNPVKGCSIT